MTTPGGRFISGPTTAHPRPSPLFSIAYGIRRLYDESAHRDERPCPNDR